MCGLLSSDTNKNMDLCDTKYWTIEMYVNVVYKINKNQSICQKKIKSSTNR